MTSAEFPHTLAVDSPQAISALPKEKIRMERDVIKEVP